MAESYLTQTQKFISKKVKGENYIIGEALDLSESFLLEAKELLAQKDYPAAYINALVSRTISQETKLMIK